MNDNVLVVDDDNDVLQAYTLLLKQQNKNVYPCNNPLEAINIIQLDWNGVVLTDIYMPYLSGIELMKKIHQVDRDIPVLLITGHGDVPLAVEAVKKGAYDFLEKPIDPQIFISKVNSALIKREQYLKNKQQKRQQIKEQLIGESSWIKQLREKILAYTLISLPVYLYGPPSTGKLLIAKQLIPDNNNYPVVIRDLQYIESFNDFEQWVKMANNGMLILQHVDLLPAKCQKILVHEQMESNRNFRLVVTSYKTPSQLVTDQTLLPEFYYLFSLTQVECISLQDRKQDIVIIFEYYLKIICVRLAKKMPKITDELIKYLNNRPWQNNIRELIHAAELYAVDLMPFNENQTFSTSNTQLSLEDNIDEYEKNIIINALNLYNGRLNEVAEYLQIPRKKLYLRMKKYGLDKNNFKN